MTPDELYADVAGKYARHLNPNLAKLMGFAGFGVETHGEGCYLYDHEGRQFLDCLGGYGCFSLGHRHPKVVEAVKRQLDHLGLSGKAFFSKPAADLAERLAQISPKGLQFTFFSNSGAEAVEAALKFARAATGKTGFVATEGSYHGKTLGALSVTGRAKYRKRFEPLLPGASFVPFGDASAVEAACGPDTAAVIVEAVQGEGGIVLPPDGYLRDLRAICDRNNSLLIVDEVQTLLGRTGKWFGCDHDGVSPDILTMAKALGGGLMPIGATMGTPAVWEGVYGENPLLHTSTFGGNPLACAAGLATIEVIQEEGLVDRSAKMGAFLLEGLRSAAAGFEELVLEARGRGLMIGVEFRIDEVGELIVAQMLKRGMCAAYTLNNPRVLRFEPPLVIDESQIEFAVDTFRDSLVETSDLLAMLG